MEEEQPIATIALELMGVASYEDRSYAHGEVLRHYIGRPYLDLDIHIDDVVDKDTAVEVNNTYVPIDGHHTVKAQLSIYPGGRSKVELIPDSEYKYLTIVAHNRNIVQQREYDKYLKEKEAGGA